MPDFVDSTGSINMPAVLIANGLGAFLILIILGSEHHKQTTPSLQRRIFDAMCVLTLCLCILETVTFWMDGKTFFGARPILLVTNASLFALDALFGWLWTCYVDYKMFASKKRLKRIYRPLIVPALLLCALCVANLFTDVFFAIGPDNVYSRRPLAAISYLVTYFYLTYGAILAIGYHRRVDKYFFMPVMFFLLPIYLGSFLQMMYYGIALIWVSVALGLTSLFINLQNEESYLDNLTGLYNRNYLMHYLARVQGRAKRDIRMEGMMLDINSFKTINDTYGHVEGDRVLRTVGSILRSAPEGDVIVTRYGGDEFVLLFEDQPEGAAQRAKDRLQQVLEAYNAKGDLAYPLSVSAGTALFDGNDVDGFLRRMDRRMYEEKRSFYRQSQNDRRGERRQ